MFKHRALACCLAAALSLAALPAFAQEDSIAIPRAERAPNLDDYISGVPADAGVAVTGFRQNAPGDGDAVSLETRVYLSYDSEHLYAVFVCKDDPKLMRARIVRRDNIFGDEGVQLFLDTFDDNQRAFAFGANPYGAQLDSKVTEGQGYDFNFDTQWVSDGRIVDDGYVVLMEIPLKSLRFNPTETQRWGIAMQRIIPRLNEVSYWPYITQRKEGFIPQFGTATIDEKIAPGRNIQVIPHVTYRDTRLLEPDGNGGARIGHNRKFDGGIDAKFVIRDSLAVDLTLNPDFSEVESDEPQVIVNERYEVLFPEKRPFFLENAGFFNTPNSLFFSRRVVDPEYGARVTGRLGRWAIGGLLMNDEAAGAALFGPGSDEKGNIGLLRLQRDVGAQSNVGMMYADRRVDDHSNRILNLDTRIKLNDNWALTGQAVRSETDDPAGDFDGHLYYAGLTRGGRHFTYTGEYTDISEDFNAELGFIPRRDIRQTTQAAKYLWTFPDAKWLVSAGPSLEATRTWNQDGDLIDWTHEGKFEVNGLRYTSFDARWIEGFERYAGTGFRSRTFSVGASTEWLSWLTAAAEYRWGESINYFPAAGLAPFLADERRLVTSLTISPTSQFRIDQIFIWQNLQTQNAIAGERSGANIFRNTLSRTKFNYQFSRFLSAHLIVDYASLDPNANLFAFGRSKRLTGDVLVSYVLNPGTALYVGYTDQQENLRLIGSPSVVQVTDDLDLHTGRQFFVKYSYLFSF